MKLPPMTEVFLGESGPSKIGSVPWDVDEKVVKWLRSWEGPDGKSLLKQLPNSPFHEGPYGHKEIDSGGAAPKDKWTLRVNFHVYVLPERVAYLTTERGTGKGGRWMVDAEVFDESSSNKLIWHVERWHPTIDAAMAFAKKVMDTLDKKTVDQLPKEQIPGHPLKMTKMTEVFLKEADDDGKGKVLNFLDKKPHMAVAIPTPEEAQKFMDAVSTRFGLKSQVDKAGSITDTIVNVYGQPSSRQAFEKIVAAHHGEVVQELPGTSKVPVSQIFKGKPPPVLKPDAYKKQSYSWGDLRKIGIGSAFTVILTGQHWWKIQNLKPGQKFQFKDETGQEWVITREGEDFKLAYPTGEVQATGNWQEMVGALN